MRFPLSVLMPCIVTCVCSSSAVAAEERWVDDEGVAAAREVVLSAGIGLVHFDLPDTEGRSLLGGGMSFEESVGLGYGLEAGARFGLRTDREGQGLRADEAARPWDTETFGTGLSKTPNPELRLRWQALKWHWGEGGLEERVVLPIVPDPNLTEVLGAWTSLHVPQRFRIDIGTNAALTWQSFARERRFTWALGLPVYVWANVTPALFVGVLGTMHYFAPTRYTSTVTHWRVGAAVGYRLQPCDWLASSYLPDVSDETAQRLAFGVAVACRL